MADGQTQDPKPAPQSDAPVTPSALKKWAKRLTLPAAAVIVGGLYQQGYISEEVYKTILRLLGGMLGFGG